MAEKVTTLVTETRPIDTIWVGDGVNEGEGFTVIPDADENPIDEIRVEEVGGEMGMVPWFAVMFEGVVLRRINGKFVIEIEYAAPSRPCGS